MPLVGFCATLEHTESPAFVVLLHVDIAHPIVDICLAQNRALCPLQQQSPEDLHGLVDNLLKILSENSFLEALDRGEAALILLGDAVHPEAAGQLEDMDSSILIMDLILKLKLTFP